MLSEATYQAVRERERHEPEVVAPVLQLLANPDSDAEVSDEVRRLAAALADRRESDALASFMTNALTTPDVLQRVTSWNDRRTVASARRRRQLLGLRVGRETYHPDWQFTPTGLRHDLGAVVSRLLHAAHDDPVLADQIMRAARPELGGTSLAGLVASRRIREVTSVLEHYREGFAT